MNIENITIPPPARHHGHYGRVPRRHSARNQPHALRAILGVIVCALVFNLQSRPARAGTVDVTRIDGTAVTGNWIGSENGRSIELAGSTGPMRIDVDDVMQIRFNDSPEAPPDVATDRRNHVIHLADGGHLIGRVTEVTEDGLVADSAIGTALRFPLQRLAGVRFADAESFPRCDELLQRALGDRLPGSDVLITRSADEPKSLRGRLEELDGNEGRFAFGGRSRSLQADKIYGVVFAVGVGRSQSFPMRFQLTDGSRFSGRLTGATNELLSVEASFDRVLEIPIARLRRIGIDSARVVYLSEMKATREHTEGRLHRAESVRRDRGLTGRPLSIAGHSFDKGLACRSRCEAEWALGGEYESFVATIGIDDAVRPRGSVVFRVLSGDNDAVLFDSGLVTGRDAPRDILVDVTGAAKVTLVVDYGDGYDLSDHAVWGAARVIRRVK